MIFTGIPEYSAGVSETPSPTTTLPPHPTSYLACIVWSWKRFVSTTGSSKRDATSLWHKRGKGRKRLQETTARNGFVSHAKTEGLGPKAEALKAPWP
jgi:hypothetical protein